MRLLILVIIGISLVGCGAHNPTYDSLSTQRPVVSSYSSADSLFTLAYNLGKYKYYGLGREDKIKQQEAVFFALDNLDNGQVVEWYSEDTDAQGIVRPIMSYPQNSGYCRKIQTLIIKGNKSREFLETACTGTGHNGWRFIRK